MYKIVGADQKEYGPVTEEQLRQWIAEGRANGQTVARFNEGPWKPLTTFPEFSSALGIAGPTPPLATSPGMPPPPLGLNLPGSNAPPATSGMAIAGLSCSIIGLFCCGPVFSTLGLVLSALALSQINQNPSKYAGRGVALAGIIVAIVGYLLFAVLLSTGTVRRAMRRFRHF